MIKINEAIIVEGKYDKIKLCSIVDAVIIVTGGFGIFKDEEKLGLIRYYAEQTGIIILTDSDSAGRRIRGYIKGAIKSGSVKNVIDTATLLAAFEKAGITAGERTAPPDITKLTLYELGLSGGSNSSELRRRLQKKLGLPSLMSATALTEVLNTMMTAAELAVRVAELKEEDNGI